MTGPEGVVGTAELTGIGQTAGGLGTAGAWRLKWGQSRGERSP